MAPGKRSIDDVAQASTQASTVTPGNTKRGVKRPAQQNRITDHFRRKPSQPPTEPPSIVEPPIPPIVLPSAAPDAPEPPADEPTTEPLEPPVVEPPAPELMAAAGAWQAKPRPNRPTGPMEFTHADSSDPGLRPLLSAYTSRGVKAARYAWHQRGPTQPKLGEYPGNGPSKDAKGNKKKVRRFQSRWYAAYPWLEYSVATDRAFCIYCYLFQSSTTKSEGSFVDDGFQTWNKVGGKTCKFLLHQGPAHAAAAVRFHALGQHDQHIDTLLANVSAEVKCKNRCRLLGSIEAVRLCAQQGLAMRGHREDEESMNRGNFLEVLQVLCSRDPELAAVSMANAPGNNKQISSDAQKSILTAHAELVRKAIDEERGDAYFCVLADEARDGSKKEQMCIGLRYVVEATGVVKERFFDLVHVTDTTSETLFNAIIMSANRRSQDMALCRGQGYDGASNMTGAINGLQTLVQERCPHAYYQHCWCHRLQLVLVAACALIDPVASFFATIATLCNCVGASCKRRDQLRDAENERVTSSILAEELETGRGKNQELNLGRPGDTRWGSHWGTLKNLLQMYTSVLAVVARVAADGSNSDMRAQADGLCASMLTFEFVLILHAMEQLLAITNKASQQLQQKDQDIVNAMDLVGAARTRVQSLRDEGWPAMLVKVTEFCHTLVVHSDDIDVDGIDVPDMAAACVRPGRPRRNAPMLTNEHRFKYDIYIAAIDAVLAELDNRFSPTQVELLRLSACLSPRDHFARFDVDKLVTLAQKYYPADFNAHERDLLRNELDGFIVDVRGNENLTSLTRLTELSVALVETRKSVIYRLVYLLLRLVLTLPVSTATGERFFSAMKLIKGYLRTTMGDGMLTDLMTVYIEKNISKSISNQQILEFYVDMDNRRGDY